MKRILLRARRDPFEVVDAEATIRQNLIGNNVGNLVFSLAAYKTLRTTGSEVRADRFEADPAQADRINDEFDAYVIPLANAFRKSFEPNLIRMTRLIEKLTIPVVVLGVGAQSNLRYALGPLRDLDRSVYEFVAAVLERSPTIGVRGEFSATYLRSLGFSDVEVIGCPSMFLHGDRLDVAKKIPRIERESRLAVNVSPYVDRMGPIVHAHLARYPNMIYVAQDLETLALMVHGDRHPQADGQNTNPVEKSHPLYRQDRARFFLDPTTWMRFLAERDVSFGTRIHGNITALLAGTPAFVLAHDSRTAELARYFEIPHAPINKLKPDVDIADLYDAADYGPLVRNHAARYKVYVDYLAKNGLAEGIFDPQRSAEFDAQLAAVPYAPAVHTVTGLRGSELASRLRKLRRHRWVRQARKAFARIGP